ncbi:CheW-like domain protein [Piscirickettsia salmonis]|uniref:CheW-like domain protein n=1 Tax=Piscirickettsia salmonis TaxID=1238 RepID=A0A1L6TAD3_PISSA|nr:chemotaxis protein CheW [Piscirickettsia salmonis]ALB22207.1 cheW-like domain protein [Piscirickettsia salmonis]ALY02313.1 chemotaxis protein CheW [Piscirickettsia salmonis]AMA41830.1 chemotaxis protein CheW [Piscirickettsia salmonis]AOS34306.1 chemotaxis protein CheW [Piscirickettsia salmonis]APS61720.1 chemotaxis protein CheW [Piscirickettsia salmonis]
MIDDDSAEILEEGQALSGYFDALLGVNSVQKEELELEKTQFFEVVTDNQSFVFQDDNKVADLAVVEPAIVMPLPKVQELDASIKEIDVDDVVASTVIEVDLDILPGILPEAFEEIETAVITAGSELDAPSIELDSVVPTWARQEFQCVSFMVQGLQLIMPLSGLNQIYALQEHRVKAIFGQADWFIGMMKFMEKNIHVLDMMHWLLPEGTQPLGKVNQTDTGLQHEFVLALEGSSWGVVCNGLGFSEFLKSDDVNWHNKDPKRPWLAGVVVNKMCGLIDPEQLVKFLNAESRGLSIK